LNLLAGGIAGVTELLCLYPLDVIKTRTQQIESGPKPSIIGTFSSLIKEGGVLRLYRGILPPLVVEPIKRSTKFAANEQYRKLIIGNSPNTRTKSVLCGVLAGITEAIVIAPFELVKVRLQAKNRVGLYANTWDCVRQIIKNEGPIGFLRGISSAIQRNGIWNGAYFGTINSLKMALPKPKTDTQTTLVNFLAGALGGTLASALNTPWDVVCSRARNILPGEVSPHRYTVTSMLHIVKYEGFLSLWKGYLTKVLRLGPGGGIMLVVFDFVVQKLQPDRKEL